MCGQSLLNAQIGSLTTQQHLFITFSNIETRYGELMGASKWSGVCHKYATFLNIKAEGLTMVLYAEAHALAIL